MGKKKGEKVGGGWTSPGGGGSAPVGVFKGKRKVVSQKYKRA